MLGLLLGVSVVSWAIIALKSRQLSAARAQSLTFLDTFWKATRLDSIYQSAQSLDGSPLSKVFCAGYDELTRLAQAKEGKDGPSPSAWEASRTSRGRSPARPPPS